MSEKTKNNETIETVVKRQEEVYPQSFILTIF